MMLMGGRVCDKGNLPYLGIRNMRSSLMREIDLVLLSGIQSPPAPYCVWHTIPLYKLTGNSLSLAKWSPLTSPCPCEKIVVIGEQVPCTRQLLASTGGLWHISSCQALAHSLPPTFVSPSPAYREGAKQLLVFLRERWWCFKEAQGKGHSFWRHINVWGVATVTPNLIWGSTRLQEGQVSAGQPLPYYTTKYRACILQLSSETRRNFEAGVNTPPPPLSWIQIYVLLQSHTSPTVCYRRAGIWLAEKADGV